MEYKHQIPNLPDQLKDAQSDREKQYLKHIEQLVEKLKMDSLTGLLHKQEFIRQNNDCGIFIFIDGDNIKQLNDITQDHASGEAAIKALGQAISITTRSAEILSSRIGGDEFVIKLRDGSLNQAANIAKTILNLINNQNIADFYEGTSEEVSQLLKQWPLTASIGIGKTLAEADKAMYKAKSNGRNRIDFYLPEDRKKSINKLELALKFKNLGKSKKLIKELNNDR